MNVRITTPDILRSFGGMPIDDLLVIHRPAYHYLFLTSAMSTTIEMLERLSAAITRLYKLNRVILPPWEETRQQ